MSEFNELDDVLLFALQNDFGIEHQIYNEKEIVNLLLKKNFKEDQINLFLSKLMKKKLINRELCGKLTSIYVIEDYGKYTFKITTYFKNVEELEAYEEKRKFVRNVRRETERDGAEE